MKNSNQNSRKKQNKTTNILWGRSNGRCAYPSCNEDLTVYLEKGDYAVIGEMAHVIARSEGGPRGSEIVSADKRNSYQNLILLCPTHHKMIDKAASIYSVEQILGWKQQHEIRLAKLNQAKKFSTKSELFAESLKLLLENKTMFDMFGPSSQIARRNPISDTSKLWALRKVSKIIPNNAQIVKLFEDNSNLLSPEENRIFSLFREHSLAFQRNAYARQDREGVPMFPTEFQDLLEKGGINE